MQNGRTIIDLCNNWRFSVGDQELAQYEGFDDSSWEVVDVPHDWSISGPFDISNPMGACGGFLPAGVGWYRKIFRTPESAEGKKAELEFDGIFRCATVWVNGQKLGFRPNSYVPQVYDITDCLHDDDTDNLIAVRVDNSRQPGHRYYSGSGIYREVRLIVRSRLHIRDFDPFVTTQSADDSQAVLRVRTVIVQGEQPSDVLVRYELKDEEQKTVYRGRRVLERAAFERLGEAEITDMITVDSPRLWSDKDPYLYTLHTTVYGKETVADSSCVRVGIRTIRFTPEEGFLLNGRKVVLQGVCLHHDNGCIGAVTNRRAEQRKLEIMREMGCNAVRLSHNPFSRGFLDLCDEMGMLVMDEAFDEWQMPKAIPSLNPRDTRYRMLVYNYYMYFDEWCREDLAAMLLRDRNHPSIVIYSIGNEIPEQRYNVYEGIATARKLREIVREYDTTRPVTAACCFGVDGCIDSEFPRVLDVIGYNYGDVRYEKHGEVFPGYPFIGTETTSLPPFRKRGYCTPDLFRRVPDAKELTEGGEVIEPDDVRLKNAERSMMRHKKCPQVAGMFIWTGMDYFGEPTPYSWPSRSSYFGAVDTCGFKKAGFYYYQSCWSEESMIHLAVHWNWAGMEGREIDVPVFTNCDSAELFLNGESLGIREKEDDSGHLLWTVPYEPGTLLAVGYKNGEVCCKTTVMTAGEPYAIRVTADRGSIQTGVKDLAYVTAEIVDKNGVVVPNAESGVRFIVSDGLRILGVDNGDPEYVGRLKCDHIPALAGMCLAVVGDRGLRGEFRVSAEADGLKGDGVVIRCEE